VWQIHINTATLKQSLKLIVRKGSQKVPILSE